MDRHYTYDEIKNAVFSQSPMPVDMMDHLCACDECMEIFLTVSGKMPLRPSGSAVAGILEKAAVRKQRLKDMMYNLRVIFAVSAAMIMLFTVPLPTDTDVDIIKINSEKINYMSERKEEFRQDVTDNIDRFIEYYTKGNIKNDKTEE